MTAAPRDLYIEQGASYNRGFFWHHPLRDAEGRVIKDNITGKPLPGPAYNLTGWRGRMQVRQTLESAAIMTATTENGMIVFGLDPNDADAPADPTNGRVDLRLPGSATDLLVSTQYKFDLKVYDTEDLEYRLLKGNVIVDLAITRDT